MSDAPLFQHIDEQEAASSQGAAENQDTGDQSVAMPAGLAPGGMGGAASVSGIPGVLPPGIAEPSDADNVADESDKPRSP